MNARTLILVRNEAITSPFTLTSASGALRYGEAAAWRSTVRVPPGECVLLAGLEAMPSPEAPFVTTLTVSSEDPDSATATYAVLQGEDDSSGIRLELSHSIGNICPERPRPQLILQQHQEFRLGPWRGVSSVLLVERTSQPVLPPSSLAMQLASWIEEGEAWDPAQSVLSSSVPSDAD